MERNVKKAVRRVNLTIDEFLSDYAGYVGYVYPMGEDSYYISSNIQGKLYDIQLLDGSLFATNSMSELEESGWPCETYLYNADEYQRLCDAFNASAGQDERPPFPSTLMCRI